MIKTLPLTVIAFVCFTAPAWADLVKVGELPWTHNNYYISSSDHPIIILDTQTGLEWLDMNAAGGLSFNMINAQTGSGGKLEGFRIANKDEMMTLFADAGLPQNAFAFMTLFDPTYASPNGPDNWLWAIAAMYDPGSSIGPNLSPMVDIEYYSSSSHGSSFVGEVGGTSWTKDFHEVDISTFLVRDANSVPEPSELLLLCIGMLSVIGYGLLPRKRP